MTSYRERELHRTIRNTRSRILLASYPTREHRDRATLAADALADLLDLLDAEHHAEPAMYAVDLRTRLVERAR